MNKSNIEFIYEVIKQRINAEFNALTQKDLKAEILFVFDGIILAIICNLYNSIRCFLLFYIGVIFLFVAFILAFIGFKVVKYKMDPEPTKFYNKYRNESYINTIEQVIVNITKNYEDNKEKINKKGILINLSSIITIIGMILIFLSIGG